MFWNTRTLPLELSKLSVGEIGAIFVIMASPHLNEEDKNRWAIDEVFLENLQSLASEEIIVIDGETVDIDLTWI